MTACLARSHYLVIFGPQSSFESDPPGHQVSKDGGAQPVWSKDGKTLYYLDAFQKLTAVDVDVAGDSLRMGPPRTLFQTGIRHSIPTDGYDVSRDGRFLVLNSITESTAPVVLVTNWDTELKEL